MNMWNNFLETSYTKCGWETSPRQDFKWVMLMGKFFSEILVGGTKGGVSVFCGSSLGETRQG